MKFFESELFVALTTPSQFNVDSCMSASEYSCHSAVYF
jgi:hypothetical protein